ncbi:3-oxoacyl-ACP reductase [Leptospira perolatii]|uniref:3-oxoacyl-ACP reductase n=1 Tax=Leptospira perolatii TaxID=2023191 RepID=A0A2M9ZRG2_9LEPT|nr:3-oxoacyl-ACP reductase FabG [Leptospira perolatii]PJZ71134.1 3-oxoacyl-ACP reductase [Leptospira perolatii]PJZ74666.1 3-oxoacyl-ACP reductase [Leptospira perolatii]
MFDNLTAVITGSARGIGKATAIYFARQGCNVIVSDLESEKIEETILELRKHSKGLHSGKVCDVRLKEDIRSLSEYAFNTTGRLDIWINNAGVIQDDLLLRMNEEKWQEVFSVNLTGAFFGTQAAAKFMSKARKGRIINIGSVSGFYGNAGQANYSAAKAGLIALTKTSARELASRNITVNCIAAGFIDNEFAAKVPAEVRKSISETIPLKINRNPEEAVASAVGFLASDEADWITGAVLRVDGGMMIGF